MKKLSKHIKKLLVVSILILASCSSNEEIDDAKIEGVMLDFQEKIEMLQIPSALENSNDSVAQQVSYRMQSIQETTNAMAVLFTVPTAALGTSTNNKTIYVWESNLIKVVYTLTEESDRFTFSYQITKGGNTYTYMDGYQLKDESYAEIRLYDGSQLSVTLKWAVKGDVVTIEIIEGNNRVKLEANVNDYSGSIKIYKSAKLLEEYNWKADGSGWYKNYATGDIYRW